MAIWPRSQVMVHLLSFFDCIHYINISMYVISARGPELSGHVCAHIIIIMHVGLNACTYVGF